MIAAVLLWMVPGPAWSQGPAQGPGQAAEEAKEKARQALDAFTRAIEQMAAEAGRRAREAADALRGSVQDSVRRACDAAQQACLKVCDGNARCEQACREGRAKCQAEN
jgi:ElaB/YqjD/DUF883 family membrane-anchored ribosome-binding protein